MIDWTSEKESRLVELHSTDNYSEQQISDLMNKEFKDTFSRNSVHNKIKRLLVRATKKKAANILLLDIETTPNLVYSWGLHKQEISIDQIVRPSHILCWSAKWLYDDKIISDCISSDDVKEGNDESIIKSLWPHLDTANILIGHNLARFDLPWVKFKFLQYGLIPPSPYQIIDTLQVSRKFRFVSHKLDWIGRELVNDRKIKVDFSLWTRCMNGDQSALDEMLKYNKKDVSLLEEVYVKLRPWISNHPNMAMYVESDSEICANCGSTNLSEMTGLYRTDVNTYQTYRCECGAINRVRKTKNTTRLVGIAR